MKNRWLIVVGVSTLLLAGCAPSTAESSPTSAPPSPVPSAATPTATMSVAEEPREGQLYVWGNDRFTLAPDGVDASGALAPVPGMETVVSAASALGAIVAVKSDGSAWWWGLPDPDSTYTLARPTLLEELTDVVSVVSDAQGFQLLTADGAVYFLGSTRSGGDAGQSVDSPAFYPVLIEGLPPIERLGFGTALAVDGSVWVWGCGQSRSIPGIIDRDVCAPITRVEIPELAGIVDGVSGRSVTTSDGRAWSLLNASFVNVADVDRSFSTSENDYYVTSDGTVFADGASQSGGLGNAEAGDPVVLPEVRGLTSVGWGYAGGTIGATDDGLVWIWSTGASTFPSFMPAPGDATPVQMPGVEGAILAGKGFVVVEG